MIRVWLFLESPELNESFPSVFVELAGLVLEGLYCKYEEEKINSNGTFRLISLSRSMQIHGVTVLIKHCGTVMAYGCEQIFVTSPAEMGI